MVSIEAAKQMACHEPDLLSILFDNMQVGIAIYDHNLVLQSFNSTWAAYAGRYAFCDQSHIVPGTGLRELSHSIVTATLPLFLAALSGETVHKEGLRLETEGIVSFWDMTFCPLYRDQHVRSIVQIASDTTDRALAYRSLEQRFEERTHETERRRDVAESLGETLALINSSRTHQEILQRLVSQARQLLGAACAAIFKLQPHDKLLTVEAYEGGSAECMADYALPVGIGAIGEAVLKRKAVLISDTRESLHAIVAGHDSGEAKKRAHLAERVERVVSRYRTAFAVPLVVRDEIYGGIALYYEQGREFTEEDAKLAELFGHQAALAIENARLRERIEQAAVMAERNRIARDLHDSVTQTLFSAGLIADVLPRLCTRNPGEVGSRVEELRQLVRGALAEMRMLLLEMRPDTLAGVPLCDLLKQLAEATGGRSRIPVVVTAVTAQECDPLPRSVHNAFYRIAQEALNNVARHSYATLAEVSLKCCPGVVELEVTDNGTGFDPATVGGAHLGLNIMQERAQEIGAELYVENRQDSRGTGDRQNGKSGTRVYVKWSV